MGNFSNINFNANTIEGLITFRNVLLLWAGLLTVLILLASFGEVKSTSIQKARINDSNLILNKNLEKYCDQEYNKDFDLYIDYNRKNNKYNRNYCLKIL